MVRNGWSVCSNADVLKLKTSNVVPMFVIKRMPGIAYEAWSVLPEVVLCCVYKYKSLWTIFIEHFAFELIEALYLR